jgi:hypothetical protein
MQLNIACRVQSHPSRRELRERLLPALAGMPVEVVETDFDPPNPWMGYLACMDAPPDCTHLLIVQDDCVACRNLTPALHLIAQAKPNNPVCLYLGMLPPQKGIALRAAVMKKKYVELTPASAFMPVVAVLWPIEKLIHFRDWAGAPKVLRRRNGLTLYEASDDAMGARWWRSTRQTVYATIPSLIEHPDDAVSTIGRTNSGRTALFWHGQDWDALSVDWAA